MNELQQVLLVFSILVILGILLINFVKKSKTSKTKVNENLNSDSIQIPEESVPENQADLPFGEEFEIEKTVQTQSTEQTDSKKTPKHHVIYDETLVGLEELEAPILGEAEDKTLSFGKPDEVGKAQIETKILAENREPEVFVIIVMSSHEFTMTAIHQALLGVGLIYTDRQTYVKQDRLGNGYIHVANVMEPGYFPDIESAEFSTFKTAGVAVILPLPTCIKAPAAMADMIMIARKVSQKLNGRLYDSERHILKESDIQVMRDSAIAYESVAI